MYMDAPESFRVASRAKKMWNIDLIAVKDSFFLKHKKVPMLWARLHADPNADWMGCLAIQMGYKGSG